MDIPKILRGLGSLYSWRYPLAVTRLLQQSDYHAFRYIAVFWKTTDFGKINRSRVSRFGHVLQAALYLGILAEISAGIALISLWRNEGLTAGWQFGVALIVAYPLVWAHLLMLAVPVRALLRPKATGKAVLCRLLRSQVVRLRKNHSFQVVTVAGSVGKTSTKISIARALEGSRRVRWQEGNYNDPLTVPLIFFGHDEPGIFNVFAWIKILLKNEAVIRREYPYDFVVAELGTDTPGTIQQFAYIKPDLVVVTAVTPEHMEYFGTLDNVAKEELGALDFAKKALVNIDDIPAEYLKGKEYVSYGLSPKATYYAPERKRNSLRGQQMTFYLGKDHKFSLNVPLLGVQGAKIALAAAAAMHMLDVGRDDIEAGVARIEAFAGRMQILSGIKKSVLIDDTYNSTPVAAKAALDVLYDGDAPQRIVILGSMNELGDYSEEAHREVAGYCDPKKLDWVVTIGADAKAYLAPVAEAGGCQAKSFLDPYKAGNFVKNNLKEGAVVLAKGSQNGVFAEESLKKLLANKSDEKKLVRQSQAWLQKKKKQFKS